METLDILAFSPHPDDAEIGCGGALLLSRKQGLSTAIADLSEGECASRGTSEQRLSEKTRAAGILDLRKRFSLGFPDTRIGFDPENRLAITEVIRSVRPRIVLAPYWVDRHPDHEAAGRLVREACFYAGVTALGQGDPFRPERIFYYMIHTPFPPSFVVDISDVWDRKKSLLEAYGSQFSDSLKGLPETALSGPEFQRVQEARAIYFGSLIGAAYGEAFFSPGPVPLKGLPDLDRFAFSPAGLPPYCTY